MTESINNYSFDFPHEAEAIRQSLDRQQRKKILFVETAVSSEQDINWPDIAFNRAVGHARLVRKRLAEVQRDIKEELDKNREVGSYHKSLQPPQGNMDFLLARDARFSYVSFEEGHDLIQKLGEENKSLMSLFVLYHETGHALIPEGGPVDELHPGRECAADAYAALRLLQRFGRDVVPFLSLVSWLRSHEALLGDTAHLSTSVLDQIIADSAVRDYSTLTPDKTIALAKKYAEQWTPGAEALAAARDLFGRKGGFYILEDLMASTCLSSSSPDLAFLVGAKVVQPLLGPEGFCYQGGIGHFSTAERRLYAGTIAGRLPRIDISSLFNEAAATRAVPLEQSLPVILPPGQKRVVYHPRGFQNQQRLNG